MSGSGNDRNSCFSYLSQASISLVALDPTTGKAIQTNETFTQRLGPLYKYQEYAFWDAATAGESRDTLRKAIQRVMMSMNDKDKDDKNNGETTTTSSVDSLCIHAVEMLTLCGDAGMPMKRFFDWTIGTTQGGGPGGDENDKSILLFGTVTAAAAAAIMSSGGEEENHALVSNKCKFKDSEFVDFFQ